MLLGLLAGVALCVEARTQSFYRFHIEKIEILPAEPSPADDVRIEITGWLPTPCDPGVSFSDLNQSREDNQTIFWATAITPVPAPTICIQIVQPIFYSYQVGKLAPGNYSFILYASIGGNNTCESEKTVLARKEFAVTRLSELPQVSIEVIPAQPAPTNDISVQVTVIDRCEFSFSELVFTQAQDVFLATIESMGCSITPIELPPTFTSTHTYQLGKLPLGEYEFQLQLCPHGLLESIIDENKNRYIDDDEILRAINLWISGVNVPGTSQTIDDAAILRLIDMWITQTNVGLSCWLLDPQRFQVTLAPSLER